MATILCIETATKNCSVALCVNGNVIALEQDNPYNEPDKGFSHAEKLQGYITHVLSQGNISKSDLIKKGYKVLGNEIFKTWSCYLSDKMQCGKCESCNNRKIAFTKAKIEDKTKVTCSTQIMG